jgi:Flp pilus assembly protein TadD
VQTLVHFCAAMLFGKTPFGFHLLSVTMHALASAASLLLLRRITGAGRAFLAACLFAVWPIHAEPVAWISAGPDVNAALFLFLCLWLVDIERASPGPRERARLLGLAGVCFFMALLSKEMAMAGPLLALALPPALRKEDAGSSGTGASAAASGTGASAPSGLLRAAVSFGIVFLLPLALYLGLRAWSLGGLMPATARPALSGAQGWGTALMLVPRYLFLAFAPWHVVPDRVVPPADGPLDPASLAGAGLLVGIAIAAIRLRRSAPVVVFALALLVAPLLPALQVRYFTGVLMADRYLYLPSLGACLLIAEAAGALFRRARAPAARAAVAATCVVLVLAAAGRTVAVAATWRDSESLGRRGVALEPRSVTMRLELIHALDASGRMAEALEVAREAQRLAPDDHRAAAAVAGLEARLAAASGGDAVAIYQTALATDPQRAHLWVGLSVALLRAGRSQEAIEAAERAIALDQFNRAAHVNLGTARGALGDYAGQEREARRLLSFDPQSAAGYMNLGAARLGQDDLEGAREALSRAEALDPSMARVPLYLSWIASRRGEQDEAVRLARRATDLDPADDEAWNRLGVALAASGDVEAARPAWEKALGLRPENEQARRNLERLAGDSRRE